MDITKYYAPSPAPLNWSRFDHSPWAPPRKNACFAFCRSVAVGGANGVAVNGDDVDRRSGVCPHGARCAADQRLLLGEPVKAGLGVVTLSLVLPILLPSLINLFNAMPINLIHLIK